ncbi:MAG TPA: FG-GAP-like repeat-containing protein, partial [Chryseosolibacter sp.]|nr:FG-GAP-like repeat-containing protein [Chryseosolibacter sp.]
VFYVEQAPTKGYLSSVDPKIHLGLGGHTIIDSLIIRWTDGSLTRLKNLAANTLHVIIEADSIKSNVAVPHVAARPLLSEDNNVLATYRNIASEFIDFNRDRLLFEMISNEGQRIATGDVNGDGREDLFIGGSANIAGTLWVQRPAGAFQASSRPFDAEKKSEDTDAVFFDADTDGDPDLFVCSGGNQYPHGSPELKDRLYINDGHGKFSKLPQFTLEGDKRESSAFAVPLDFNNDGHMDLVVGSRVIPFYYGVPANAYLYENDGHGRFRDVTAAHAPGFLKLGLLRDAVATDIDRDQDTDLVVCGEWMPLRIFENVNGKFIHSGDHGLNQTNGLWNTIEVLDVNDDGYPDLVAGNNGLNSRYKASAKEPLRMYVGDFDSNGNVDHILCQTMGKKAYPMVMLPDLTKQMPVLRKKFVTYDQYKDKSIEEVVDPVTLENAIGLTASDLETCLFINEAGKGFKRRALPAQAQFTKICGVSAGDFNVDGKLDLVLAGNHSRIKPELGLQNAGYGVMLIGDGTGEFNAISARESGLVIRGEVRDIANIRIGDEAYLLFLRNNDKLKVFKQRKQ